MIPARAFDGRKVAVFGLGRTGLAAVRALRAGGAEVLAWDDNPAAREAAEADGFTLTDLHAASWKGVKALVLSPGVPLTHPEPHATVKAARKHSIPVIGDIELFAQERSGWDDVRVVGVTGTNGKSTTTALIGHVLRTAGCDARVGGNIGEAVLNLDPPRPGAIYVLELSSYQLDLAETLRCDVALFLNLAPDHLDRHGDMDGYLAAKMRIFRNQTPADAAILGVDDHWTQGACTRLCASGGRDVIPVSSRSAVGKGVYVLGSVLYDALDGAARRVADLASAPALPGRHNHQNAAAAYAAARRLGLTSEEIAAGLTSFPGLAHRQERVAQIGRVSFINDSKATNADAAAQAMGCYQDMFWIAGGQAKAGGIETLRRFFPNVRKAYLIGEDAGMLDAQIGGAAPTARCGDLEAALEAAARDALASDAPAPVVLLSPACASFDQFKSFEHRGDVFRAAAQALADHPERLNGDAA
jgi:UDP-N-acetylmuramoylalanine--D-glutamate ligase